MAQVKNHTGMTDLLLKCMSEPDPMPSNAGAAVRSAYRGRDLRRTSVPSLING